MEVDSNALTGFAVYDPAGLSFKMLLKLSQMTALQKVSTEMSLQLCGGSAYLAYNKYFESLNPI